MEASTVFVPKIGRNETFSERHENNKIGGTTSFLGDPNENKSPLNPILSKANMGPVFDVALDYHPLRYNHFLKLDNWEKRG
jgi:hypothetical protein